MSKPLRISIPKPCHEDWNQMTPAEKGRYCSSCQKVVMDFTSMSDSQIAAYFKKGGSATCGRFYNDQLNRPITIPKKRMPWVRYFFQVAIPAFLISCRNGFEDKLSSATRTEQTLGKVVPPSAENTGTKGRIIQEAAANAANTYNELFNSRSYPMIVGGLSFEEYSYYVVEDEEPKAIKGETSASFVGTDTLYSLTDTNYVTPVTGDIVIVEDDTAAVYGIIEPVSVNPVQPESQELPVEPDTSFIFPHVPIDCGPEIVQQEIMASSEFEGHFSLYPNPAKAGSDLTIAWKNESGKFKWQIIDMQGRIASSGEVKIEEKFTTVRIHLPNTLLPGAYVISFVSTKGKVFTEKLIVRP